MCESTSYPRFALQDSSLCKLRLITPASPNLIVPSAIVLSSPSWEVYMLGAYIGGSHSYASKPCRALARLRRKHRPPAKVTYEVTPTMAIGREEVAVLKSQVWNRRRRVREDPGSHARYFFGSGIPFHVHAELYCDLPQYRVTS